MTCAHLQCERPRISNGLCRAHNNLMLRGASIAHPLPTCAVRGCGRKDGMTRGYCRAHSIRITRHGSPLAHIPLRNRENTPARLCSVEDCTGPVEGKGLCKKHRARLRRTGTVELLPREAGWTAHPRGITTREVEIRLYRGETLAQIADSRLIHPKALRLWLDQIGRHDLLGRTA